MHGGVPHDTDQAPPTLATQCLKSSEELTTKTELPCQRLDMAGWLVGLSLSNHCVYVPASSAVS